MNAELVGILPEIVVTVGGLLLLVLPGIKSARLLGLITLGFLAAGFDLKVIGLIQRSVSPPLFYGMLLQDRLSGFFQLLILVFMSLVTLSVMGYAKEEVKGRRELYALLLLTTVGLLVVVGAQHFALLYLSLELVSILSYLLTGIAKRESLAVEGALKYFLFGALATGAMLYGISLIYGLTGTMDIPSLATSFPDTMKQAPFLGTFSLLLLLIGFGFKVALVPFHMWAPDAYEGASAPIAAFISVGPKLAGFAVLSRLFLIHISPAVGFWPPLLAVVAALSMTIGNVVALVQTNVKRLLAYSSIAHAGTITVGLAVATPFGMSAAMYYLLAYLLMNIGAFAGVAAVGNAAGREDIGAFAGLSRRDPLLAFLMTISLLSLAGIPPLAGFFSKMWIMAAALEAKAVWLAVVTGLNSVVAIFYYMKIVKAMYLDPAPAGAPAVRGAALLKLSLLFCTAALFGLGLFQGPWLVFTGYALPVVLKPTGIPWMGP